MTGADASLHWSERAKKGRSQSARMESGCSGAATAECSSEPRPKPKQGKYAAAGTLEKAHN
eukprot:CAMPEP_0195037948 /NCGR_PEP_ID=MMETSP0326_2-20130528/76212_1 /TAXON_ID=2866 ORGANISM="Crypthecodinium cohnii, Strain Seligo" /NCGR_SAMPLE_ID=MMETSP0326_2 /ASSEMBLY_ACC=CAM_ASM_000348 /LENGTH=60 /DNA_ID=CAMNT_0040064201 /DNA_START=14 /DNA_END=196 /DNA_ORIENTATION=+